MRFSNAQYLEKEVVTVSVRNNEASLALLDGQPVYGNNFQVATNFGVDVVSNVSTTGQSPDTTFLGVLKWSKLAGTSSQITGAQPGDVTEAVAYGFTDIILTRRTRAASTDTWPTVASVGFGNALIGESVGNNFSNAGIVPMLLAIPSGSTGQTVTLPSPIYVILASAVATLTTAASSFANAAGLLYDAYRVKGFVRAM